MAKVYIGVGHGIQPTGTFDPGAVAGAQREYDSNRRLVAYLDDFLRAAGHVVNSEAERYASGADPNYVGSTKQANAWPADLALEVHRDWSGGSTLLWPLIYATGGRAEKTAKAISAKGTAHGIASHAPTVRSDLYFPKVTTMPAVLIECGRVGQAIDEELWARAIAEGVCVEWGGTVPAPAPPPPPPTPPPPTPPPVNLAGVNAAIAVLERAVADLKAQVAAVTRAG